MANNELLPSMTPIEHIRKRPGMYIGKLGDGGNGDDGIYIILDIVMWFTIHLVGIRSELEIEDKQITLRCYGSAIPFDKINSLVTNIQKENRWSGRHDMFGLIVVNALSSEFSIASTIDGQRQEYKYREGIKVDNTVESAPTDVDCTQISYIVDESVSGEYNYNLNYIEAIIKEFICINRGFEIVFNGIRHHSENGMLDLLNYKLSEDTLYPPIHLHGEIIDIAFTHLSLKDDESSIMFANGFSGRKGSLYRAFRIILPRVVNGIFNSHYHSDSILRSMISFISIEIEKPIFEPSTKFELYSKEVREGLSIAMFLNNFLRDSLRNYLVQHPNVAEALHRKIKQNEELITKN